MKADRRGVLAPTESQGTHRPISRATRMCAPHVTGVATLHSISISISEDSDIRRTRDAHAPDMGRRGKKIIRGRNHQSPASIQYGRPLAVARRRCALPLVCWLTKVIHGMRQ
jgi:hypothetical protein